jgi:hypothetical protein
MITLQLPVHFGQILNFKILEIRRIKQIISFLHRLFLLSKSHLSINNNKFKLKLVFCPSK